MSETFKLQLTDLEGNFITLHYKGSQKDATAWAEELFAIALSAENILDCAEFMDAQGQIITYIGN